MERDRDITETIMHTMEVHQRVCDSILTEREYFLRENFSAVNTVAHDRRHLEQELSRLNADIIHWCWIQPKDLSGKIRISEPVSRMFGQLRLRAEQAVALTGETMKQFEAEKRKTAASIQQLKKNTHAFHSYACFSVR
jgi:hypothetical protein